MKRKNIFLIGIFLLAIIFIAASLFYINNVFLPQKIKAKLIAGLEIYFKQNVEIEKLSYGLIKGLKIQGLSVYEKTGSTKHTTLIIKEVSFNPLALPLFNKKIIIPSLNFESLQIYLKYKKDKTFNLPLAPDKKPAQKKKWDILIAKIRVRNAKIQFSDENITPAYNKEITGVNIGVDFNLKKEANFFLQAELPNTSASPTKLNLHGSLGLEQKTLKARLKADTIALDEYTVYLEKSGLITWLSSPPVSNIISYTNTLKNLSLEFNLSSNKLEILKASLETMGAKLIFSGQLEDFKHPQIIIILTSRLYNLNADLKTAGNTTKIDSFKGFFKNTAFNITGEVDTKEKDNPLFNLNLDITTNPKDLAADLPVKFKDLINKLKIDGLCNITGTLLAHPGNFRSWKMNLEVASPELRLLNYRLKDLSMGIEQANKLLKIKQASATAYNGEIELNMLSNLALVDPPFNMEINARNIDLAKLKQDIGNWKEKDISGLFNLTANSKGTLKNLNNLKATGSISMKEGNLWELNLLKGLAEFLFLPSFKKVVFNEGTADFEIENQVIYTNNALLKSTDMNLLSQGNIGFDKKLQLLLTTEMNLKMLEASQDPRRFTTFLTGNFLLVRIDGTLDEPQYHISTVPQQILNDIKDYFLGKKQ